MMYVDMFAHPLRRAAIDNIRDVGIRNFVRNAAAIRGHGTAPEISDKYRRLEDLPEGTWGRQLAACTKRMAGLSGEKHGFRKRQQCTIGSTSSVDTRPPRR